MFNFPVLPSFISLHLFYSPFSFSMDYICKVVLMPMPFVKLLFLSKKRILPRRECVKNFHLFNSLQEHYHVMQDTKEQPCVVPVLSRTTQIETSAKWNLFSYIFISFHHRQSTLGVKCWTSAPASNTSQCLFLHFVSRQHLSSLPGISLIRTTGKYSNFSTISCCYPAFMWHCPDSP